MPQLPGIAKRECLEVFGESTSKWGVPDLSECVSDKMINIAQQVMWVFFPFFNKEMTIKKRESHFSKFFLNSIKCR